MDKLPHSLLLQILSRLDDSADVARCRVASKAFDTVFPDIRSINLVGWVQRYMDLMSKAPIIRVRKYVKPFKTVFLDMISKLKTVESVCISLEMLITNNQMHLIEMHFFNEWLPRVSDSLKSLSIDGHPYYHSQLQSYVLPQISEYCHNLVNLKMKYGWLSVENLNPMPMLTSLTLEFIDLEDGQLNTLNKCFPNLQEFNLLYVTGLIDPMIHLLDLKTFHLLVYTHLPSLTLITPNLITLRVECHMPVSLCIVAPMLSDFHLSIGALSCTRESVFSKFKNLKTVWLESSCLNTMLSEFPITRSVEKLTVELRDEEPRDSTYSRFTLSNVFIFFRSVSSLCIKSRAWSELETYMNLDGFKFMKGWKGLKTLCAYLMLVDPSLTFSYVAGVLDQCVGLSDISFLIHGDVAGTVSDGFMSNCMARWPGLNWRWGIWSKDREDSWIAKDSSIKHQNSSKRRHL